MNWKSGNERYIRWREWFYVSKLVLFGITSSLHRIFLPCDSTRSLLASMTFFQLYSSIGRHFTVPCRCRLRIHTRFLWLYGLPCVCVWVCVCMQHAPFGVAYTDRQQVLLRYGAFVLYEHNFSIDCWSSVVRFYVTNEMPNHVRVDEREEKLRTREKLTTHTTTESSTRQTPKAHTVLVHKTHTEMRERRRGRETQTRKQINT